MPKLKPYPFWIKGGTPQQVKLPKMFRRKGNVSSRELGSIVRDRKTGQYKKRTFATKDT